jgi:crotonobetainyl-CoA:carnitine CoA-transferase CaiB-like acyl-CoA transferase
VRAAAPVLGAHTDEILRTVLGYSDAEIERMRSDGILS